MTLSYLKDKLLQIRKPLYSRTNYKSFHEIRCNPFRHMNSFFPDAITSWNNIIKHFHNTRLLIFLKIIFYPLFVLRPRRIFGVNDPLGLRYLFQLRINLSPLRSHKSHNFLDTHSDICHCNQGIEDVSHFLFMSFFCKPKSNFNNQCNRDFTKNNLNHLCNLYGHSSINVIDNRKILLSTIKNIKDTQRFAS